MSLIQCPECGNFISSKALTCPYCGYYSKDPNFPISLQERYEVVPLFQYEVSDWIEETSEFIAIEDNRALFSFFGKWENIQRSIPALAETIKSMAKRDHILVAKMDDYVKELIEKGIYRFSFDSNGEILPTIRDASGFVKQVRLQEMSFSPQLLSSLNNLSTQVSLNKVIDEIEGLQKAINSLHLEFQNDRIAKAESAKDLLNYALQIQDPNTRRTALLNSINTASEAKRLLMRSFINDLDFLMASRNRNALERMMGNNDEVAQKAAQAFQSLALITNCVQIESTGFAVMGEYESCKSALSTLKDFIDENDLDRDTLLFLNECTPQKKIKTVNKFMEISHSIREFEDYKPELPDYNRKLLEGQNFVILDYVEKNNGKQ